MKTDNTTTQASSGGVSLLSMLTVLFVGLRLTGHIDWSWWYVLAPTWVPLALVFGVLGIFLIFMGIWYVWLRIQELMLK